MASNDSFSIGTRLSREGSDSLDVPLPASATQPQRNRECNQDYFRESFADRNLIYSECARIGRRALSWLTWIPGLSENSLLDWANKEVSHEHISFDQSEDNIGFGRHGLFAEDTKKLDYRYEPDCYDGERMRRAISEVAPPESYSGLFANCQAYIESVLERYFSLGTEKGDPSTRA